MYCTSCLPGIRTVYIKRIWAYYMAAALLCLLIAFNIFLRFYRPFIVLPSHPKYVFYIAANILLTLGIAACIFESFYQRSLVRFFTPVRKLFDRKFFSSGNTPEASSSTYAPSQHSHISYMDYNKAFLEIHPMGSHLSRLSRQYRAAIFCSRFFILLMYITTLCLAGILDFLYTQAETGFFHPAQLLFSILLLFYLVLVLCLNTSYIPEMPAANSCLFFLLLLFYLIAQAIYNDSVSLSYYYQKGTAGIILHTMEFTVRILPALLFVCLYFLLRSRTQGDSFSHRNIQEFDSFAELYIDYSNIIYGFETDEKIYSLLCNYTAVLKEDGTFTPEHLLTLDISQDQIHHFLRQHHALMKICEAFTDKMLKEYQNVFGSLPQWSLCLLDEDFPQNILQCLSTE